MQNDYNFYSARSAISALRKCKKYFGGKIMKKIQILIFVIFIFVLGCQSQSDEEKTMSFKDDLEFLQQHMDVIVLENGLAKVALITDYQGRIMTSTADGDNGLSFGWINRELIASGENLPHINVFGGEDRFWLGPEGGQYSIFFKKDDAFDLEHWQTPAAIDWDAFEVVSTSKTNAVFQKNIQLTNYSDTMFDLEVTREIKLLSQDQISANLGIDLSDNIKVVGFESINTIKNTGAEAWEKENGLLSIWILGMFNPSPNTTIVVPFVEGSEAELGRIVNDAYFGKVPSDRLVVKDDVLFFSGDGNYRSKIGLSPQRSKPILGSYDAANKVLTLAQFTLPKGATDYVNSMWELQDKPYGGDVVNSYNDGPAEPGAKPLGPFYELETSSPAAALQQGESLTHVHRTIHLMGSENDLNQISEKTLSVSLEEIKGAL